MDFSKLLESIENGWDFIWPPTVVLIMAYFIARLFYPQAVRKGVRRARTAMNSNAFNNVSSTLEKWHLKSIIPTSCAILIITILYVVNVIVFNAAHLVPPHITFSPSILVCNSLSPDEKLILARLYPLSGNSQSAYSMAIKDLDYKRYTSPDPVWKKSVLLAKSFILLTACAYAITICDYISIKRKSITRRERSRNKTKKIGKSDPNNPCATEIQTTRLPNNHTRTSPTLTILLRSRYVKRKTTLLRINLMIGAFVLTAALSASLYKQHLEYMRDLKLVRGVLNQRANELLSKEATAKEKSRISDEHFGRWWTLDPINPRIYTWINSQIVEYYIHESLDSTALER